MDMEGALRARLIAAPAVIAAVWKAPTTNVPAIYWVTRPQGTGLPAITLQIIDDPREQHMKDVQGLQSTLVQIDVWATTYAQGKALKEAVIAALLPAETSNGIKFGRAFVRSRDLSERVETQLIYRPSMDFTIWHSPA